MGFFQYHFNHTCFICQNFGGQCIVLLVYMDDIILIGDDSIGIGQVKKDLSQTFDIKDLGCLKGGNLLISKKVHP